MSELKDIIWCDDHEVQEIIKVEDIDGQKRFHLACGCVWRMGILPELKNTAKAWGIRLEELIREAKKLTEEKEKHEKSTV